MVIELLLSIIIKLISFILNILPGLPQVPESFSNIIDSVLDIIFENGAPLISLFIRPSTITIVVPILIVLINFEYIYKLVMWIVKKIPISME